MMEKLTLRFLLMGFVLSMLASCGSEEAAQAPAMNSAPYVAPDTVPEAEPSYYFVHPTVDRSYTVREAYERYRQAEEAAKGLTHRLEREDAVRARDKWLKILVPLPLGISDPDQFQVHTVQNAGEFNDKLGSNRALILEGDAFLFRALQEWIDYDDISQGGMRLMNLQNLAVLGMEENTVVELDLGNQPVVYAYKCGNLYFRNLYVGHHEATTDCFSGGYVFEFIESRKALVEDCALFGCGVVGLRASSSEDIELRDSRIFDCSHSAVDASISRGIQIRNVDIYQNSTEHALFRSWHAELDLISCHIHDNQFVGNPYHHVEDSMMFFTADTAHISLNDCRIEGNNYPLMRKGSNSVDPKSEIIRSLGPY